MGVGRSNFLRGAVVGFVLLSSGLKATGQSIADLSFGTDTTLEVMTWNIERFPKNGITTVDYVVEIIEALQVDLIALQEIDDQQSFDAILQNLGSWSGYWDDVDQSGLAYIYNPDVIEVIDIFQIYPSMSREFPRPPLVMEFSFAGQFYVAINNHLKCCGNGVLDSGDAWDEETRRRDAAELLQAFIETNHPEDQVFLLGDLNDELTDSPAHNVFNVFFDAPDDYVFVDQQIAEGPSDDWSFPNWPSHIDHILISDELFDAFVQSNSEVTTVRVDDFLQGGFETYDDNISDHRPVALKLDVQTGTTSTFQHPGLQPISVYPNPSFGSATFERSTSDEAATLVIRDALGRSVERLHVAPGQRTVHWQQGALPAGVYNVQLLERSTLRGFTRSVLVK